MCHSHRAASVLATLALAIAAFPLVPAFAAPVYSTSFESGEGYSTTFDPDLAAPFYAPGSIHTQPTGSPGTSWFENSNGGVHGEIVVTPLVPAIPPGLGSQSLYFRDRSDTVLIPSPGFGASTPNQSPHVDAAGETGSYTQGANSTTPGVHARTVNQLQAEFWFRAGAADITSNQIFLNLNLGTRDTGGVGPSRRYADGFLAQSTTPGKFNMKIQEIAGTDPNNFVLTAPSADLNRDEWYRIVLDAVMVDGLAGDGSSNDIVTMSAYDTSNVLQATITGRTHEVGYKYSSAGVLRPGTEEWSNGIAINAFGYRLGASVTPDELGYLDNLTLSAVPEPGSLALAGFGSVVCAGFAVRRRLKQSSRRLLKH
jgi:hypothetical protein